LRYRGFAHYTNVVMPANRLRIPTQNIDIFNRMNIGLMAIDQHSNLQFIRKPKKEKPTSKKHHLYALGQMIAEFCRLYPGYEYKEDVGFVPFLRRLFGHVFYYIR